MTERNIYVPHLSMMKSDAINRIAVQRLRKLAQVASLRLIAKITRIHRSTLMRWHDQGTTDFKTAAWFIVCVETDFRLIDLLDRPAPRGRRNKATLRQIED